MAFLISAGLLFATEVSAYEATLAWDANIEPDLAGYKLYRRIGDPCPPYDLIGEYSVDVIVNPLLPDVKVAGLANDSKYYFVVTAYDTDENESGYSNIVHVINGQSENASCSSLSGGGGGGGGGGG